MVNAVVGTLPVASRRGIKQIRADGRCRMDAEQQDQNRRHQRTSADAGQTDQQTDGKSGKRIEWL
jgi:hypothetical protein